MTGEMIKQLLDSCFLAKKITETMPELPKGLKPRHIHIITQIALRSESEEPVRVGDISSDLKITMPSVTKLINELADLKIIGKYALAEDKRAAALSLTELGKEYYERYVIRYHGRLLQEFSDLDMGQCQSMITAIETLYQGIIKVSKEDFDGTK